MRSFAAALALALVSCHSTPASKRPVPEPVLANTMPPPRPQRLDLDSTDILARTDVSSQALVKHVLIGWAGAGDGYRGVPDPRAERRTQADAARLAETVAAELRATPSRIDALIQEHGEDPGALSLEPYEVKASAAFIPEFKNLALRLKIGEVGIVKTRFGYHVVIRVAPPPPDPLESADILARPTGTGPVDVQHILIGWENLPSYDPRAAKRKKAEADALASELLAKVRAGGDMAVLMAQYSEDPGSAASGKAYTVEATSSMVEGFKELALRLDVGEAGLVKSSHGWHIIKRVPPPPPDPLDSVAILARTQTFERTKVKHILLGWNEAHAEDPRGAKRTRKELEKLVKATLKRLDKKGVTFEKLMAELSEDPGSAKSGESYTATPNTGLVKPFLNLSLRLNVGELGVVRTEFGIHIIKRVE